MLHTSVAWAVLVAVAVLSVVQAITIYGQLPLYQTATETHPAAPAATTLAAYNSTRLQPPRLPESLPARQYTLQLPKNAAELQGLSIPHVGVGFWGFSIEMSVISQVLGRNSTHLYVPFLNLLANLQERSGGVVIRLGGNTQEFAALVPPEQLGGGRTFGKTSSGSTQTTKTPAVLYTIDMFYMQSNISSMLNVKWFMGIPFNDSVNWRISIAEEAQTILGDNLLALQVGNEPDFYVEFQRRVEPYGPADYIREVQDLVQVMDNNPRITNKKALLGPSVASAFWQPEQVWDAGFMELLDDRMYAYSVEHYPDFNCAAQFNNGEPVKNPQDLFPGYLEHTSRVVDLVRPYWNSTGLAVQRNKPFFMFETNTASCGGFAGISDSYGAALWATDYGMQMAYANFTHGMLHVGGQNVFYNPFTSPPTNQSMYNEWTIGSVYYAAIVLAEAFGKTNTSRIVDLHGNSDNKYTPSYAIYERDVLNKVALFNYLDDQTGANDEVVTIQVPQGNPPSVRVKYLLARSVSDKVNITWAGQTLGNQFQSDGHFKGELNVTEIPCTPEGGCPIPLRAPGFALVFLDTSGEQITLGQATQTFTTTAFTNHHNTVTTSPDVLETSNGHSGGSRKWLASTSFGYFAGNPDSAMSLQINWGVTLLGAVFASSSWIMTLAL